MRRFVLFFVVLLILGVACDKDARIRAQYKSALDNMEVVLSELKAVEGTPLEYLLTETDSSKPEGVKTVCKLIADLKGLSMEEVGRVTTENLMRLCGL